MNDTIEQVLITYFSQAWSAREEPVFYPNDKATPPEANESRDPWLRFTVRPGAVLRSVITGTTASGQSYGGVVFVQVFDAEGIGTARISALAAVVESILSEKSLTVSGVNERLNLDLAQRNDVGSTGGGWYQMNVFAPYSLLNI